MLSIYLYKNRLEATLKILLTYDEVVIKNVRMNLNGNKLANVRRDIMNNKRLTDIELREIKENFITDVKDTDSGNVGIRDRDNDDKY